MDTEEINWRVVNLERRLRTLCCCVDTCLGISSEGNAELVLNQQGDWIAAGGSSAYLVYTALLSQTAPSTTTSGLLIIGETYTIDAYIAGDDFANVATVVSGTINTTGCVFVATGTTPTDWTNSSTLTSSGNPIPTVLQNTLGGIPEFSYSSPGEYFCDLTGAFTLNSTFYQITNQGVSSLNFAIQSSVNRITISTADFSATPVDGVLSNTPFEIRVYP